jgi:GNAT superfamily N-acetyltransferase
MTAIRRLSAEQATQLAPDLAEILRDCVAGGASVHFRTPPPLPRAIAFWQEVAAEVGAGRRILFVVEDAGGVVSGTVQLLLAQPENQPHRAEIAKLLVHRRARGSGLATALMQAAEAAALEHGKTLLLLDTEAGSAAERLYRKLGWTGFGVVPDYALDPAGTPRPASFFYRRLAA